MADAPAVDSQGKAALPGKNTINIIVMGPTGTGKTKFINDASGSKLTVGRRLRSCTHDVQLAEEFMLDGRQVRLIDTPGFDDTTRSDKEILGAVAGFLVALYKEDIPIHGVIYIYRISDRRMTGTSMRNFHMLQELCGEQALSHIVLVTNMWGKVTPEVGNARENELTNDPLFFKNVLAGGAVLKRNDTPDAPGSIVRYFLDKDPVILQIQEELNEGKSISGTAAGLKLLGELAEQERHHEEEIRLVKENIRATEEIAQEENEYLRMRLEAEQKQLAEYQAAMDAMEAEFKADLARWSEPADALRLSPAMDPVLPSLDEIQQPQPVNDSGAVHTLIPPPPSTSSLQSPEGTTRAEPVEHSTYAQPAEQRVASESLPSSTPYQPVPPMDVILHPGRSSNPGLLGSRPPTADSHAVQYYSPGHSGSMSDSPTMGTYPLMAQMKQDHDLEAQRSRASEERSRPGRENWLCGCWSWLTKRFR